jgi:hypothetical protein
MIIATLGSCGNRYANEKDFIKEVNNAPNKFNANSNIGLYYYDFIVDNNKHQKMEIVISEYEALINNNDFPKEMESTTKFSGLEQETAYLLKNSIYYLQKAKTIDSTNTKVNSALSECYKIIEINK